MKILVIRTTPNIMDLNSYNIQEFGLAKALIRKGHTCDVAFYGGAEKDHIQEIKFDGDKVLRVIWLNGFGCLYEGFFPTLYKYINQYDIIQVGGYVGLTSCFVNRRAKDKVVNYNGLYYYADNTGDIKKAKLWDRTLLPLQRRKNMIVATKSVLAEEYVRSKGIENVTTVGVGLDLDNMTRDMLSEDEHEFVKEIKSLGNVTKLLYIGVLEDRRNIPFIFQVFKKVNEQLPDCRLVIIGKGKPEYVSMCKAMIKELGIQDKILYQERLDQKYMPSVYRACDAFLLPTRYEIFGMVLLEAMYYGLPVFTTYNGGSSTIMNEENGIVLDCFDVDVWSENVVSVLRDEDLCGRIGDAAYKTIAEEYTWDALADKFLTVYQKRLANGGKRR